MTFYAKCLKSNHTVVVLFQIAEVGSWVVKIEAEDQDALPEYNTVTYSIVIISIFLCSEAVELISIMKLYQLVTTEEAKCVRPNFTIIRMSLIKMKRKV